MKRKRILIGIMIFCAVIFIVLLVVISRCDLSPFVHAIVTLLDVLFVTAIPVLGLRIDDFRTWLKRKIPLRWVRTLVVIIPFVLIIGSATALKLIDENQQKSMADQEVVQEEPEEEPEIIAAGAIGVPEILVWLMEAEVYNGTFLSPDEVDAIVEGKLEQYTDKDASAVIVHIDGIANQCLTGDLLSQYKEFAENPASGEGETSALGLSDAVIKYAKKHQTELSVLAYANLCMLSTGLALCEFTFVDEFESSPFVPRALNRLWARFEDIARIPDLDENMRIIFYDLAASCAYIRIGKSYNGERDKNKKVKDIRDCRVLYIRMMDIALGHNRTVGRAFAFRGRILTELAAAEGLTLPGDAASRASETARIEVVLQGN